MAVGVDVRVCVRVGVGVFVGLRVSVRLGVGVGVGLAVLVGVRVGVRVRVRVRVGVGSVYSTASRAPFALALPTKTRSKATSGGPRAAKPKFVAGAATKAATTLVTFQV